MPEPSLRWLHSNNRQPFPSPWPLGTDAADVPTRISKQGRDPQVAEPIMLANPLDHVGHERLFVCPSFWQVSLFVSVLAEHATDLTF